jgi:phage terminase large subunit
MIYNFNSKYFSPVHDSNARIVDISGGRGRGGSHFVTEYYRYLINQSDYFRGYFMREIFGQIKESLYQDFKDRVEEDETDSESNYIFNDSNYSITSLLTGNKIISKGFKKSSGKQTAKLKSIAGATHVIIEECEEITEDDFNKLQDSLRTTKSELRIFRVWNPPGKDHWLIKNYYNIEPSDYEGYFYYYPKNINGFLSVYGTYLHNIANINESTIELWESYKETNLEHYCSDILGLVSGGVKGQIYKNYTVINKWPEREYMFRIFGMDFGYTNDPTTLIELLIDKPKRAVYIRGHCYKTQMGTNEIIQVCKDADTGIDEVIVDNAEPRESGAMQMAGIQAIRTKKGGKAGDKYKRIKEIMQYNFFVLKDSGELGSITFEMNNYKWAINSETKTPINKPEDKNDHYMDALLYALGYYHRNYGII